MEILPYVQKFLLQFKQCVGVINPYLNHWSIADILADFYNFRIRVLVDIDEVLELKRQINLIFLPFNLHTIQLYQ